MLRYLTFFFRGVGSSYSQLSGTLDDIEDRTWPNSTPFWISSFNFSLVSGVLTMSLKVE